MIVMVSNDSGMAIGYLAAKHEGQLGHLYSPGGQRGPWHFLPFALDNGAYSAWENDEEWSEAEWLELLEWAVRAAALLGLRPLWVLVPDVVADRIATLERWRKYAELVKAKGFRCAFAVQDRMTFADVPDDECVIFLGGSLEWKLANIETWCTRFPGRVHVAKVNTWDRLVRCWRAGAISVDGTGWFREGRSIGSSQAGDLRKFLRETKDQACTS